MKRTACSIATVVLAGCSRFSGCFSKEEAAKKEEATVQGTPAFLFSEAAQEQAHLVAAYLVTKGVRYEQVYGTNYKSDSGELTLIYQPEGNAGDYTDDQFIAAFESASGFSVLYYDYGLDGIPDMISDVQETSPVIPLEVYSPEDQQVQVNMYRTILSTVESMIQKSEDVDALKKVGPQ